MNEDEKFEELVPAGKSPQISVRLPPRAEEGFERWREYLGMSKGAFAVLCIRVGLGHMKGLLVDPWGTPIDVPPEAAIDMIEREAPDEKEY